MQNNWFSLGNKNYLEDTNIPLDCSRGSKMGLFVCILTDNYKFLLGVDAYVL